MIKIVKSDELEERSSVQKTAESAAITTTVATIIANVIKNGDEALREYTEKLDGCVLESFELSQKAMDNAVSDIDPEFIKVMERAAVNIEDFHRNQVQTGFDLPPKNGVIVGQRILPIERVGIYIPGGSAAYSSSVLMNCIPAKIAGVSEIILTTPPSANGKKAGINGVDAHIISAAKIVGIDRIFTIGGAQAIAAMAYGTKSVPRVDKITGPGNAYVTEAKRQVFGAVGVDMIAGPSDILIIACKTADPVYIAADMLSQCEHGPDSSAILVTTSTSLARRVRTEIELQLLKLPREKIARTAIENQSLIIVVDTIDEAFRISNERAPEHLEIFLDEPFDYLDKVKNAGSVFLGEYSPETLGDYYAGPNHTIPTSGTARFSSQLSVDDFVKKTSYTYYSKEALRSVSEDAIKFAEEEGLAGHALSVSKRLK